MTKESNGSEPDSLFALVLFLPRPATGRNAEETDIQFVQYVEVTPPFDEVDWTSGSVRERSNTSYEND